MKTNGVPIKCIGEGKVFDRSGTFLEAESYKLSAERTLDTNGHFYFFEKKTFLDGKSYEVPFTIDPKRKSFFYEDPTKSIKGFYPADNIVFGEQSWHGVKQTFIAWFDTTSLTTMTTTETRVYYEVLRPENGVWTWNS